MIKLNSRDRCKPLHLLDMMFKCYAIIYNMKKTSIIILIIVLVALGATYATSNKTVNNPSTNSAENAPEGSIHNLPVPAGVSAARKQLAEDIKIDEGKILVMTAFEKEWSDSCLGLGGPAESCLMAITPGYEVTMQAEGKTYIYHTNTDGTAVRLQN